MKKKLNEAPQLVNQKLYSNLNFKDRVVGTSTPSKDKINPSLLSDIETAAKKAGVIVSITTAVSGHDGGSRHEKGNAVDIAMFNGKGFSSKDDAENKGIYGGIHRFLTELIKMGYEYNKESGNDKAVLSFGFKDHDNHVHVSRNSYDEIETEEPMDTDDTKVSKSDRHNVYGGLIDMLPLKSIKKDMMKLFNQKESIDDKSNRLNEDINKIKKLIKY